MNATTDIKTSDQPFSERYRIVARDWLRAKKELDIIDKMKSHELEKRKREYRAENPDEPGTDSYLERVVVGSEDWADYLRGLVEAQSEFDTHNKHLKIIELEFEEWRSSNARARKEQKMY